MASARQFQFFFQLTAALGPNFSKTFKTANSTMTLLGDNLKEVRNKLKDVSAYQKQQTAVERSKQRVTDLEKEHERLQAEYDATGGESEKLKKKLEANTEALAKARDKAADETEKLQEMGQALQEAGVNTDNLAKNTEELQKQYDRLQKSQEKVAAINEKIDKNNAAIAQTKSQLTGTIGAIAAVGTAIYAGPVKKAAEFQEQMSGVKAISGATTEEIAQLSNKAKEMGASTKFTATEAGQAMEYMAMAGWKTEDMLGGIEGIMNLAAASGEDLASVSDIVTDALTAFGLSASDAGHFSDVLAQASSNANTNVKHTRHLKKPLLEFQYNDSDTASLTIYLSAFLGVNPKKMQDKIDKYRKKGKILTLIIGGKKYGSQWVITGHSKDYEKFDNQGNLLIAKSTLSLEQYAKR